MFYVSVSTSQFFQGRGSHWKTSRSSWPLRANAGKGYDLESFSWFRRNNRNNSPWPWLSWLKPRLLPLKATCQHSFGCIPWSHPCNSDFKQTELKGANSVIPWFALLTGRFWCWKAPKKTGRQSPVASPGENVTTWLFGMASTLRHLASTRDVVVACHHSEVMWGVEWSEVAAQRITADLVCSASCSLVSRIGVVIMVNGMTIGIQAQASVSQSCIE